MSEYQEFTGKTVEEAIRSAREAFGVGGLEDLDFEILTQGSRGVLGMGAEPARIIAAPRSALGGAAPKKEAASVVPTPPPSPRPRDEGPREPRPRRDDRRDERSSRSGGRDAAPDRSGDPVLRARIAMWVSPRRERGKATARLPSRAGQAR